MSNNNQKEQGSEKPKQTEEKIVSLCEDMNHHEHDEKSYSKMKANQDVNK